MISMEVAEEPLAGGAGRSGQAQVQGIQGSQLALPEVLDPLSLSCLVDSLPAERPAGPLHCRGERWQVRPLDELALSQQAGEPPEEEGLEEEEGEDGLEGRGGKRRASAEARGYASDPDAPPDIDSAGAPPLGGCCRCTAAAAGASLKDLSLSSCCRFCCLQASRAA